MSNVFPAGKKIRVYDQGPIVVKKMTGWIILLILLAVALAIYLWQRNIRSFKQFGETVRADVQRLTPQRQSAAPAPAPEAPEEQLAAAYAARRRRRDYY